MDSIVIERIAELLRYRRWYREHRWAIWTDMRKEHEVELRALVRLARQYRKAHRDPYPSTATYDSWTQGEMAEAFGK
jgi:hypothetical protein